MFPADNHYVHIKMNNTPSLNNSVWISGDWIWTVEKGIQFVGIFNLFISARLQRSYGFA